MVVVVVAVVFCVCVCVCVCVYEIYSSYIIPEPCIENIGILSQLDIVPVLWSESINKIKAAENKNKKKNKNKNKKNKNKKNKNKKKRRRRWIVVVNNYN